MHDAIQDAVREYFNERKMADEKNSRTWLNAELSDREIWRWIGGTIAVIVVLAVIVWRTL